MTEAERRVCKGTGGRVKLKTITEIRQSRARGAFTAGRFDLVLNSLWDWEPVERLKQRSDVVSFTLFQDEARSTILRQLWTEEAGRPERTELQ